MRGVSDALYCLISLPGQCSPPLASLQSSLASCWLSGGCPPSIIRVSESEAKNVIESERARFHGKISNDNGRD